MEGKKEEKHNSNESETNNYCLFPFIIKIKKIKLCALKCEVS